MEAEFVRWLQGQCAPTPWAPLGLLDDAAWIRDPRNASLVVTTDMLCEGVHFEVEKTTWERIGRKALAVNLSDLAAKAATPQSAFLSLAWPYDYSQEDAKRVVQGLLALAREYDVILAGGDTNRWTGGIVINVTLLGHASPRGPLMRSSARPGDTIVVTGPLGGSLLGHQFDFTPRLALAQHLHEHYALHASMDISDGLSIDLDRLTRSSGVGARLELTAIPIAPAALEASRLSGRSPLDHALGDGEDFELLLTIAPEEIAQVLSDRRFGHQLTPIGKIIDTPGLWATSATGQLERLPVQGYLH